MKALKMMVRGDKLIGDAPPGLPEGTILELCLAEPDDRMSAEEAAKLNEFLEASLLSVRQGRVRDASEVLATLDAKGRKR